MKATGAIIGLCLLTAAGLAVWLKSEYRACARLDRENGALRRQLSRRDGLLAENQRLNVLAQVSASPSRPAEAAGAYSATDERAEELIRLRGKVEALRQQSKEIEALRADTREVQAALEESIKALRAGRVASGHEPVSAGGSQFEILKAEYWTDQTNLDVAAELKGRIRDDSLKAVASNNLKGDPDFGHVKRLTVVYRYGGVVMTNEFMEGDLVVLPKE